MKIEKMNDNQVKFLLTEQDLTDRNLRLSELAYGSEKTQELFHEIMERANIECDFQATRETPMIIEAVPMKDEGITIIITKVATPEELENRFGFSNVEGSDMPNPFKEMTDHINSAKKQSKPSDPSKSGSQKVPAQKQRIFVFNTFDLVTQAAIRTSGTFNFNTSLYKLKNKYYLIIENGNRRVSVGLEGILREYGTQLGLAEGGKEITKMFLAEHGEVIINRNAVNVLAHCLG